MLMRTRWLTLGLIGLFGLAFFASTGRSKSMAPDAELPDAVAKTFKTAFPKAVIQKLDVDIEDGVTIYDFEFKDGAVERETDIAADGTMMEVTLVIDPKTVPAAAMKTIRKGAKGATLGRTERIQISWEPKDGKVIKLPKMVTRYAAEMTKGDQKAEVIVTPSGTVVEPSKWIPIGEGQGLQGR